MSVFSNFIFNYSDAKESLFAFSVALHSQLKISGKVPQESCIPTFLIAFHYGLYPERLRGSFLNFEVSVLTKFPFAVYPAFTQKDFHKFSGKLYTPDDMKHNSWCKLAINDQFAKISSECEFPILITNYKIVHV